MLGLLRRNPVFFLFAILLGLLLRLFFVLRYPGIVDDSHLYADIALNWLHQGVYGITNSGQIMPTLSRLPGYPAFLAGVFFIFGANNFRAVLLLQVLFDLGTCFLIGDIARRMLSERSAKIAFLLASLCPFLADYAAAALTETLEIFFTILALEFAICAAAYVHRGCDAREPASLRIIAVWFACGLSAGICILLRPDGGILAAAIGFYLGLLLFAQMRTAGNQEPAGRRSAIQSLPSRIPVGRRQLLLSAIVFVCAVSAPLIPWTVRNLHTFHRFQPLAPRYANDADDAPMPGFNRWAKTWIADYTSVEEIYWKVPGDTIDVKQLPRRAFDSPEQRKQTEELFADYNQDHDITPEIDARFTALASERIHSAPVRYYMWLPLVRIADMWLRPRTELLASDPRWWEFNDAPAWLTVSIVFGVVNLLYVAAGILGMVRERFVAGMGLFIFFVLLRSAFLGTLENPEPRYTLECYPVVIVAAAALFIGKTNPPHRKAA